MMTGGCPMTMIFYAIAIAVILAFAMFGTMGTINNVNSYIPKIFNCLDIKKVSRSLEFFVPIVSLEKKINSGINNYLNVLTFAIYTQDYSAAQFRDSIADFLNSIAEYYSEEDIKFIKANFSEGYYSQLKYLRQRYTLEKSGQKLTPKEISDAKMGANNLLRVSHSVLVQGLSQKKYGIKLFEDYIVALNNYIDELYGLSTDNDNTNTRVDIKGIKNLPSYTELTIVVDKISRYLGVEYKQITKKERDATFGYTDQSKFVKKLLVAYSDLTNSYIAPKKTSDALIENDIGRSAADSTYAVYKNIVNINDCIYEFCGNIMGNQIKIKQITGMFSEINTEISKLYFRELITPSESADVCSKYSDTGENFVEGWKSNQIIADGLQLIVSGQISQDKEFANKLFSRLNGYAFYIKKLAQSWNTQTNYQCYIDYAKVQSSLVAASVAECIINTKIN